MTPGGGRDRRRVGCGRRSPSIAGRAWRSWRPATRSGEPASRSGPAGIPDANGPGLRALVPRRGRRRRSTSGSPATTSTTSATRLRRGIAEADAVIVSGGVSVGPYDVVRAAFEEVGTVDLWRVAVQPGKPFAFGRRPGRRRRRCCSSACRATRVGVRDVRAVRPAGDPPAGRAPPTPPRRRRGGADDAVDEGARPASVPAGQRRAGRRRPAGPRCRRPGPVRLAGGQGSHVLSALAAADALAVVPEAVDALPRRRRRRAVWLDRP